MPRLGARTGNAYRDNLRIGMNGDHEDLVSDALIRAFWEDELAALTLEVDQLRDSAYCAPYARLRPPPAVPPGPIPIDLAPRLAAVLRKQRILSAQLRGVLACIIADTYAQQTTRGALVDTTA